MQPPALRSTRRRDWCPRLLLSAWPRPSCGAALRPARSAGAVARRWQHLNRSLDRLEAVHNGANPQGALRVDAVALQRSGMPARLLTEDAAASAAEAAERAGWPPAAADETTAPSAVSLAPAALSAAAAGPAQGAQPQAPAPSAAVLPATAQAAAERSMGRSPTGCAQPAGREQLASPARSASMSSAQASPAAATPPAAPDQEGSRPSSQADGSCRAAAGSPVRADPSSLATEALLAHLSTSPLPGTAQAAPAASPAAPAGPSPAALADQQQQQQAAGSPAGMPAGEAEPDVVPDSDQELPDFAALGASSPQRDSAPAGASQQPHAHGMALPPAAPAPQQAASAAGAQQLPAAGSPGAAEPAEAASPGCPAAADAQPPPAQPQAEPAVCLDQVGACPLSLHSHLKHPAIAEADLPVRLWRLLAPPLHPRRAARCARAHAGAVARALSMQCAGVVRGQSPHKQAPPAPGS